MTDAQENKMANSYDEINDWDEPTDTIDAIFSISSYGADYPIDGLVKRLKNQDIYIPRFDGDGSEDADTDIVGFQRNYVWGSAQADRFIESLLLGLPVPGIFLVKEANGRLLVLDGQQRLLTILQFYEGIRKKKVFSLEKVQNKWKGKTYKTLDPVDRRRMDDYIIHATIIKQDEPSDDQNSIYLIFERLNSGGTSLQPQEIRSALYHGKYADLLKELNQNTNWRKLVGRKSDRLKDMELILRFFSLFYHSDSYKRPMKDFLNKNMGKNRNCEIHSAEELRELFHRTVSTISEKFGADAFRRDSSVNAALLDSIMYAVAKSAPRANSNIDWAQNYRNLLLNDEFLKLIKQSTADERNVKRRLEIAKTFLG